jgi:hypothetical protein
LRVNKRLLHDWLLPSSFGRSKDPIENHDELLRGPSRIGHYQHGFAQRSPLHQSNLALLEEELDFLTDGGQMGRQRDGGFFGDAKYPNADL